MAGAVIKLGKIVTRESFPAAASPNFARVDQGRADLLPEKPDIAALNKPNLAHNSKPVWNFPERLAKKSGISH